MNSPAAGVRAVVWLSLLLWALAAAPLARAVPTPTFPLQDLHPGLRGYGLTAGPGNVIERFPVEVLALQRDIGTGFPVVLVRATGEFIARSGGVAAGMSGSPVYLPYRGEDALLGAIGFTFPGSDHELALVTPIAVMKRARPLESVVGFGPGEFAGLGPAVPVATPLLVSGLSERAAALLQPLFSGRVQPLPVQVSSPDRAADQAYLLQPGSAISVQLVRGDITVAAVGTLTLVEDGLFWAFGHPLLGQGPAGFALAPAYVSFIVPSQSVPFKLADSGQRLLGTVTQDRPFAISGVLDRAPDFIPVALTLNGPGGAASRHFEVVADERYYPALLAAASLQAMDEALAGLTPGTAELAWQIELASGRTIRLLDQVTGPADLAAAVAERAGGPLGVLAGNVFEAPGVTGIDLNVTYRTQQRYAEVVEVEAERSRLQPGEMLTLYVRLQPYRAEPEVRTLRVAMPEDSHGQLEITVRGGTEPAPDRGEEELRPLSFDELVLALTGQTQSSDLVVETSQGESYIELDRLALPYPVKGSGSVTVNIDPEAPGAQDGGDGGALSPPDTPERPPPPLPVPDVPR